MIELNSVFSKIVKFLNMEIFAIESTISNTRKHWLYTPLILILICETILILHSKSYFYPGEMIIWRFPKWLCLFICFFLYLIVLRLLISKLYKPKESEHKHHRSFLFWIERSLVLCIAFTPLILADSLLRNDLEEAVKIAIHAQGKWFLWWPFFDSLGQYWGSSLCADSLWLNYDWWLDYFFILGLLLWITEKLVVRPIWGMEFVQWLVRYSLIILAIVLCMLFASCILWIHQIEVDLFEESSAFRIIASIFVYNYSVIFPFIFIFPILIYFSESQKTRHSLFFLFSFYKIYIFGNLVTLTSAFILSLISLGSAYHFSSKTSIGNIPVEMWKIRGIVLLPLTPLTVLLPSFAKMMKDHGKYFEDYFRTKIRHYISSMKQHIVILGYGYLGKGVIRELRERGIIKDKDSFTIMTPTLEIKKIYKNVLIVDKKESVFENVFPEPTYGRIGVINSEVEYKNIPLLVLGLNGDANNINILDRTFNVVFHRPKSNTGPLYVSTIPNYTTSNQLVNFIRKKDCYGILVCQDVFQYKDLIRNISQTSRIPGTLYPPYLEGDVLGRVACSSVVGMRERNKSNGICMKKGDLPRILIVGGDKTVYYFIEAYLIGLQQQGILNPEDKNPKTNICIISNEEYYNNRSMAIKETELTEERKSSGLKYRKLTEIRKSPSTNYTGFAVTTDIIIGEVDRVKTIQDVIRVEKPKIILITHKDTEVVLMILEIWITVIVNFKDSDCTPTIIVGVEGEDEKVRSRLKYYRKEMDMNETSYPIQEYDSVVKIYDDSEERIGCMVETFRRARKRTPIRKMGINKYGEPVYLNLCSSNKIGAYATILNRLAGVEGTVTKDIRAATRRIRTATKRDSTKAPSFYNAISHNCPGHGVHENNRFLIECDIILEENNGYGLNNYTDENMCICEGLVMPHDKKDIINNLLSSNDCVDSHCIHREFCGHLNVNDQNTSPSTGTAFAKLLLCADYYNIPGSKAHVINNLLFSETRTTEQQNKEIVDLSYIRSYSCLNLNILKKEIYGNFVTIKEDSYRKGLFAKPCISKITICPTSEIGQWKDYCKELESFLNLFSQKDAEYSLNDKDPNNIKITRTSHRKNNACPETCSAAIRESCIEDRQNRNV